MRKFSFNQFSESINSFRRTAVEDVAAIVAVAAADAAVGSDVAVAEAAVCYHTSGERKAWRWTNSPSRCLDESG